MSHTSTLGRSYCAVYIEYVANQLLSCGLQASAYMSNCIKEAIFQKIQKFSKGFEAEGARISKSQRCFAATSECGANG